VEERHFTMKEMAVLGSVPFWGLAVSTTICGWASDNLIMRGVSATRVRKAFAASGLLLCTLVLPAAMIDSANISVVLITFAYLAFGLCTSNHWAITQTLAGPSAAGKWTGMQNGFGNLAGVVAPLVTGLIVSRTGSFYLAFVVVAILLVVGATSYVFVIGPLVPVDWKKHARQIPS
jgi:MFS transporter, ACS family, D-galactonate transporter